MMESNTSFSRLTIYSTVSVYHAKDGMLQSIEWLPKSACYAVV